MNLPWMRFHTRDWLDNKELRRCSPPARAVLADLMCLAHEGTPYGYLGDKLGPLTFEYMAARSVMTLSKFKAAVQELTDAQRIAVGSPPIIYIPRMIEDEALRLRMSEGGRKGGNPKLVKPLDNREVNLSANIPDKHASARADSVCVSGSDSENLSGKEDSKNASILVFWQTDETYTPFVEAWREVSRVTSKPLIDDDFAEAHYRFKFFDIDQKELAAKTTLEHLEKGVWTEHTEPRFIPLPKNYLEREYKRPVIAPKPVQTKQQIMADNWGRV